MGFSSMIPWEVPGSDLGDLFLGSFSHNALGLWGQEEFWGLLEEGVLMSPWVGVCVPTGNPTRNARGRQEGGAGPDRPAATRHAPPPGKSARSWLLWLWTC